MAAAQIKCESCGKLVDGIINVSRRVFRTTEQGEGIYVTTTAATFCDWPCLADWASKRGPESQPNVMWGDL